MDYVKIFTGLVAFLSGLLTIYYTQRRWAYDKYLQLRLAALDKSLGNSVNVLSICIEQITMVGTGEKISLSSEEMATYQLLVPEHIKDIIDNYLKDVSSGTIIGGDKEVISIVTEHFKNEKSKIEEEISIVNKELKKWTWRNLKH